jgi:predicted nucleic acid-binding protein
MYRGAAVAVFDTAARLRAETGMKLIDALHYVTALKAECKYFITNDTGIRSTDALEVISIKDCCDLTC